MALWGILEGSLRERLEIELLERFETFDCLRILEN
jgi:hypothetical protein